MQCYCNACIILTIPTWCSEGVCTVLYMIVTGLQFYICTSLLMWALAFCCSSRCTISTRPLPAAKRKAVWPFCIKQNDYWSRDFGQRSLWFRNYFASQLQILMITAPYPADWYLRKPQSVLQQYEHDPAQKQGGVQSCHPVELSPTKWYHQQKPKHRVHVLSFSVSWHRLDFQSVALLHQPHQI